LLRSEGSTRGGGFLKTKLPSRKVGFEDLSLVNAEELLNCGRLTKLQVPTVRNRGGRRAMAQGILKGHINPEGRVVARNFLGFEVSTADSGNVGSAPEAIHYFVLRVAEVGGGGLGWIMVFKN
jgi:hypothetical protein